MYVVTERMLDLRQNGREGETVMDAFLLRSGCARRVVHNKPIRAKDRNGLRSRFRFWEAHTEQNSSPLYSFYLVRMFYVVAATAANYPSVLPGVRANVKDGKREGRKKT